MMIKEKPIIFSTPLIPAIQNLKPNTWPPEPIDPGKPWKWQTRRIVKDDIVNGFDIDIDGKVIAYIDQATGDSYKPEEICPYPPGRGYGCGKRGQKEFIATTAIITRLIIILVQSLIEKMINGAHLSLCPVPLPDCSWK